MLQEIELKKKIRSKMSETEYLDFELANEGNRITLKRYEFLDGEIREMGYATDAHEQIVINITFLLKLFYRKMDAFIYGSNRLTYVEATNRYFYPDAQLVEGEPEFRIYKKSMKANLNPTLLIEIISDSSIEYDHIEKWNSYQTIPSLKQYIMISQKEMKVESYRKVADEWMYVSIEGKNATIKVLDCKILLEDLYEQIIF